MVSEDSVKEEDSQNNNHSMGKTTVKVVRWGFIILGVVWLVFGLYSLIRITGVSSGLVNFTWIITGLMFINGALLIWIGWGLREAKRNFYFLAGLSLGGNILLTITDEFGIFDLVTLLIAIGLFIILRLTRSNYLQE